MTVIIYTKDLDPYSHRAKALLTMKRVAFIEKKIPEHQIEMERVTGSSETPQIVINGRAIGSFDALGSLELQGKLDELLKR